MRKSKLIQFEVNEEKFNRIKNITVIEGTTIKDFMTEILDKKLATYPEDVLIQKWMDLPMSEKLTRVVGLMIEGGDLATKENKRKAKLKGKA